MTDRFACQQCIFWEYLGEGETDLGKCRRHAPHPEAEDTVGTTAVFWPDTRASDWCGEGRRDGAARVKRELRGAGFEKTAAALQVGTKT